MLVLIIILLCLCFGELLFYDLFLNDLIYVMRQGSGNGDGTEEMTDEELSMKAYESYKKCTGDEFEKGLSGVDCATLKSSNKVVLSIFLPSPHLLYIISLLFVFVL